MLRSLHSYVWKADRAERKREMRALLGAGGKRGERFTRFRVQGDQAKAWSTSRLSAVPFAPSPQTRI